MSPDGSRSISVVAAPALNDAGQVAFAFSLSNNRQGISVWSPDTLDSYFNGDGVVDAADYVVWRKTLGQIGGGLAADGNNNGSIDPGDYDVWRANFGRTAARQAISALAVPEPSSIAALFLALAALRCRRRAAS